MCFLLLAFSFVSSKRCMEQTKVVDTPTESCLRILLVTAKVRAYSCSEQQQRLLKDCCWAIQNSVHPTIFTYFMTTKKQFQDIFHNVRHHSWIQHASAQYKISQLFFLLQSITKLFKMCNNLPKNKEITAYLCVL